MAGFVGGLVSDDGEVGPVSRGYTDWFGPVQPVTRTRPTLPSNGGVYVPPGGKTGYGGSLAGALEGEPGIVQAGLGALGGIGGMLGGLAEHIPSWLMPILTAGAGYLLGEWNPLGGDGGGGLVPTGGGAMVPSGGGDYVWDGIVMQGPGLKEPHPSIIAKEWSIVMDSKQGDFRLQFYRLRNGTTLCYNQRTGIWKKWRPQKMAVIGKNMPSHKNMTRLKRNLKRHTADAKTILQITSPATLGYRRPVRRRRRR